MPTFVQNPTLSEIIYSVVHGHAFDKHIQAGEFTHIGINPNDPKAGELLRNYIHDKILTDPDTQHFRAPHDSGDFKQGNIHIFHPESKTVIVLEPSGSNPLYNGGYCDLGTIYSGDTARDTYNHNLSKAQGEFPNLTQRINRDAPNGLKNSLNKLKNDVVEVERRLFDAGAEVKDRPLAKTRRKIEQDNNYKPNDDPFKKPKAPTPDDDGPDKGNGGGGGSTTENETVTTTNTNNTDNTDDTSKRVAHTPETPDAPHRAPTPDIDAPRTHAIDVPIRGTNNFLDTVSEGLEQIASQIKFLKGSTRGLQVLGQLPIISGVALLLGGGASLMAQNGQLDLAEELFNSGEWSLEQYESYQEFNRDAYRLAHGEMIGSAIADQFGGGAFTIAAMAEVERRNAENWHNWVEENHPNMDSDLRATLSPSIFPGASALDTALRTCVDNVPDTMDGQPEYMSDLVTAMQAYNAAIDDAVNPENRAALTMGGSAAGITAGIETIEVQQARDAVINEMGRLLANPETADSVLTLMSTKEKMKLARSLAQSDENPADHPEVARYVAEHSAIGEGIRSNPMSLPIASDIVASLVSGSETITGAMLRSDDILKEQPELLDAYIGERVSAIATSTTNPNFMSLEHLQAVMPRNLPEDAPYDAKALSDNFRQIDELNTTIEAYEAKIEAGTQLTTDETQILENTKEQLQNANDNLREYYNDLKGGGNLDEVVAYTKQLIIPQIQEHFTASAEPGYEGWNPDQPSHEETGATLPASGVLAPT